jgi:hypothetical protein
MQAVYAAWNFRAEDVTWLSKGKWAASWEPFGQGQAILGFYARQETLIHEAGTIERIVWQS